MSKAIAAVIGLDEIVLLVALALIATGFTQMPSWQAGSWLAPGLVLLWIGLPQRDALIERAPTKPRTARRTA